MITNNDEKNIQLQIESLKAKTGRDIKTLPTAIYARKSKEDIKNTSITSQVSRCKEEIDKCPFLQLISFNNGVFSDDGLSGMFTRKRESFKTLRDLVRNNKVFVVVVYSYDRLSRSIKDFAEFESEIESKGRNDN